MCLSALPTRSKQSPRSHMLEAFENYTKLYHFVSILSRYITGPGEGPMALGLFVIRY